MIFKLRNHVHLRISWRGFGLGFWTNNVPRLPKWTVSLGPLTIWYPGWRVLEVNTEAGGDTTFFVMEREDQVIIPKKSAS